MTAVGVLCAKLPVKIVSEANRREHWRGRAKRAREQRRTAHWMMQPHECPPTPMTLTLTRIAPRELDSDNLASGFKATRDGIADWLRIDDGDKRLTWRYEQRKGKPREYAAEVMIEWVVNG